MASGHGFTVEWRHRDWGSERYRRHGRMMPVDGIEQIADADAILLGAVGAPDVPDEVTLWGLLIPIRREFLQYVNLRPVRILPGVTISSAGSRRPRHGDRPRERRGEYSEVGGCLYRGRPAEMAIQEVVFTREGVDRVARFARDLAPRRSKLLVSATKSNGIIHTMSFWDEVVQSVVDETSEVELERSWSTRWLRGWS